MLSRSSFRVAITVVIVIIGASACSSGGSSGTPDSTSVPAASADASGWAKDRVAVIRGVASRVETAFPGECTQFIVNERAQYVSESKKLGGPRPEAVGNCSALNEGLEIAAFATSDARDTYVTARRDLLCKIASDRKVDLPGLYWVVGGTWSLQPDSEGVGRRVADALGATYRATGCNDVDPGWAPAGVTALEKIAATIEKNKAGCADLQMADRDLVSHTPPYTRIGTPAAVATCTLASNSTVVLEAYDSSKGKASSLFDAQVSRQCGAAKSARVVRVGDAAIFASDLETATSLATAVNGSVDPRRCPTS